MTVLYTKAAGISICILLQILMVGQLQAQPPAVTLTNLIKASQHHLPILLEKDAQVASATAGITDARHGRLPQLKLLEEISGSSSNNVAGAYFPMGTIPSVSGSIRGDGNLRPELGNIGMVYSQYDLVDFGFNKALVNNAKALQSLAVADKMQTGYVLEWQVGKAYFSLMKAAYQLSIDEQNEHRYDSIYKVIKALTMSGIRPGTDSSEIIAELATTRINYNNTYNAVEQLQQQLSYYTGMPAQQISVDTTSQLVQPSELPAFSNMDSTVSNPLLSFYTSQAQYYKTNELLIAKSFQPKIQLLGGAWGRGSSIGYNDHYKDISTGVGYQRFNYAIAVSFVYNLFDVVHRKDKLAVTRYKTEAGNYALQQQQEEIDNQLQQADIVINTDEKNLRQLPQLLHAAQDAYAQKLAEYNAGIINLVDLTDASYVLYKAQTNYITAINDWYISSLNKAAITGNLDQFIQFIKK